MNRDLAFKVLLALVGLAHLALGLLANVAPAGALSSVVSTVYGASIDVSAQSHHVIRIVGAFMIGVAIMAFLAARDPQRNQAIVLGIAAVLLLRVVQRLAFAQEIASAFQVSQGRIWVQAAFFLATALALLILRPRTSAR